MAWTLKNDKQKVGETGGRGASMGGCLDQQRGGATRAFRHMGSPIKTTGMFCVLGCRAVHRPRIGPPVWLAGGFAHWGSQERREARRVGHNSTTARSLSLDSPLSGARRPRLANSTGACRTCHAANNPPSLRGGLSTCRTPCCTPVALAAADLPTSLALPDTRTDNRTRTPW